MSARDALHVLRRHGGELGPQSFRADLVQLDASGSAYRARWVEALRQEGIDVLDLTPALQSAGGVHDPRLWAPETHDSPDGNRVVAETLAAYLAPH